MLLERLLQQPDGFGAHAVQLLQLGGGHIGQLPESVYPAAVSALVAGAPMFPGRPWSAAAMSRMISVRWRQRPERGGRR